MLLQLERVVVGWSQTAKVVKNTQITMYLGCFGSPPDLGRQGFGGCDSRGFQAGKKRVSNH